jgi:hypothetical protein
MTTRAAIVVLASDGESARLTNLGTLSGIGFGLAAWLLGFAIHPL